jgi:hypothetical protein
MMCGISGRSRLAGVGGSRRSTGGRPCRLQAEWASTKHPIQLNKVQQVHVADHCHSDRLT